MKTITIKHFALSAALLTAVASCKQEQLKLVQPTTTQTTPSKGNLDFTKFISIGNSLTSGFQAGALFTSGQQNSFPLILSKQFSVAQGTAITFNQPDIKSVNGYNASYSDPTHGVILGRLFLYAADTVQADAMPTPAGAYLPAGTAPYNSADLIGAYTGDKTKLNNFGVPGILLGHIFAPQVGDPTNGNPYYARFASAPGTSTILGDALATNPTFFTFDLGNNDVLGYAISGGKTGATITSAGDFDAQYKNAINTIISNTSAKGVLTTVPDVTTIPFFTTITWNYIPLDDATATMLMGADAFGGYNQIMTGIAQAITANPSGFGLDAPTAAFISAQISTRLVNYTESSNNAILIKDETLVDMKPFFDALLSASQITQDQRTALEPYRQIRQTTSADYIPLSTAAVLGQPVSSQTPQYIYGVSVPLDDQYVLIKPEVDSVKNAVTSYNSTINAVAASYSTRIAVADVYTLLNNLVAQGFVAENYVTIKPTFAPPFGAFSEDGVHLNSRGYAYMANAIIDAINAKTSWGAYVPPADISQYSGTGLPYGPNGLIH